ncbi:MAG TPA: sugar transferase [Oscillatoriaceae cyanobacterium]
MAMQRAIKRLVDLGFAVVAIALFSPLFVVLPILIRRDSSGPALFTQERPGLHGRIFRIYKYRTMSDARDAAGNLLPDAERLTPLGRLLRRTSLDELPQLFNVLRGEISLVGPRPLLVKYLPLYSTEQARRHDVMPGITGWAQVNGRNAISWEQRFTLDVWYVENWSLWLDLKILALTVLKVLKRADVSAAGHVTMPEFTGSKEA